MTISVFYVGSKVYFLFRTPQHIRSSSCLAPLSFVSMPEVVDLGGSSPAMMRMKERLGSMETEEGRRKGFAVRTRPEDIFIVTTPKAGTTWTQQVRPSRLLIGTLLTMMVKIYLYECQDKISRAVMAETEDLPRANKQGRPMWLSAEIFGL